MKFPKDSPVLLLDLQTDVVNALRSGRKTKICKLFDKEEIPVTTSKIYCIREEVIVPDWGFTIPQFSGEVWYPADGKLPDKLKEHYIHQLPEGRAPLWTIRLFFEIRQVRRMRLHSLTEEDAKSLGVEYALSEKESEYVLSNGGLPREFYGYKNYLNDGTGDEPVQNCRSALESYKTLWDKVFSPYNAKWDSNPEILLIKIQEIKNTGIRDCIKTSLPVYGGYYKYAS